MVDAAEAFVIPDKLRILPGTGREGVACPGFTLNDLIVDLRAILFVDALNADGFFLVSAHFVVNHHVKEDGDLITFECVDSLQQLSFVTVLGGDAAFLVKLTEVEKIVSVVSDRVPAGCAFTGWRQPDHIDADFVKIGG